MSSLPVHRSQIGNVLVLLASLLGLAWYAQAQLIYSLAFLYQLALALIPGLAALRGAP